LAIVKQDGKWGVIDKAGKQIAPCIFNEYFYQEDIIVCNNESKVCIIVKTN